jgi:RNA polymerase sigma factor (sigma-70 family)
MTDGRFGPVQMNRVSQQILRLAFYWDGGDLTDAQLLNLFLSRHDERAFEALIYRHGPMVLGVCKRTLGCHEDAEDAFQATFLVLVRKARSIKPRGMVGNWLHGVAYRTAMKSKVMRARRVARERRALDMARSDARQEGVWEQLAPLLDKELNGLPGYYRSAVILCDLEGMSRKEAARKLGWSEGTLSGRLARARALLARRLSRFGLSVSGGALAVVLSEQAASACLSSSVVASTTKAAMLMATGQATVSGLVSANVLSLTNGVSKAMLLTKLKITTLTLLGAAVLGVGVSLLPGPAQAQKQEAVKSKATTEASAELGKAQIEVAEAQVKVAESLMQEAEVAIQTAEVDSKGKMTHLKRMEEMSKQATVSMAEVAEARSAAEKAENEILAKRTALRTAQARVGVAKAQVKVVIAQVKLGNSQP